MSASLRLSVFYFLGLYLLPVFAAESSLSTVTLNYAAVTQQREFDAVVEAVNKSTIAAQVSDRITEINYDVDDYVPKGAVVMRFQDRTQKAQLAQAEAGLQAAQVEVDDALTEFNRIKDIYAKKLVAKAVLDKANAALKTARARQAQAEARVSEATEQLERTIVRAPYSGIVTQRHVEVGETPRPGQALMTGLALDKLRVVADIPQQFVSLLRGDCCPARVLLPNSESAPVAATSMTVFPIADERSHSFRVRVVLVDGQHGLYPGMFVKLVLDVAEQQRLLIPVQAVVRRSEVTGVYIMQGDKPVFRYIRTGRRYADDRIEVHAGLEAGDKLALDPVAAGIYLKQFASHE